MDAASAEPLPIPTDDGHTPSRAGGSRAAAVLALLRPIQWVKNVLLFIPLLLSHQIGRGDKWQALGWAFLAFGLAASSVYVVNDALDVEADRLHPRKRLRPFAAGRLPLSAAPPLAGVLLLAAAACCLALPGRFAVLLAVYLVLSTAYSFFLKARLLVDVMVLAGLYTLRILAGGAAADVVVSKWLDAFSMFLFVSLAFAKRYAELVGIEGRGGERAAGRDYQVQDLRIIESVGPASGYLAVLVLAQYINEPIAAQLYPHPIFLWLLCPLLLYWVTRIWFLARRRALSDDPIVFAIRDRVSWGCLAAALSLAALASWHKLQF